MPTIELTVSEISKPSALTWASLEGAMLWPDNETERKAVTVAAMKEELPACIAGGFAPLGPGNAGNLADLVEYVMAAPSREEIQARARRRNYEGALVGHMVCELIDPPAGAPPAKTMEEAKDRAARHLSNTIDRSISVKTFRNSIWHPMKPVAHLWAAYICRSRRGDTGFPCATTELADFLAVAELMLREGARFKATQNSRFLLDAGTAWRPSLAILKSLPEMAFE